MWWAVGIWHVLLVTQQCLVKGADVNCLGKHCRHHEEACKITNVAGTISGTCVAVHGHETLNHEHIHYGCPADLKAGHHCFCEHQDCVQPFTNVAKAGAAKAGTSLQCGTQTCTHDQVCEHKVEHHSSTILSICRAQHELHHDHATLGCSVLPTEHHPCYCTTDACNKHFYNMYYRQQHHTGSYQCGDVMCAASMYCNIEQGHHGELHTKCEANIKHNFQNCIPNLFKFHHGCYCHNEDCVNHALISIIHGLHITGLICGGKDINHVCHHNQVCELRHDVNGIYERHCAAATLTQECTHAPMVGQRCHCTTQECVYGQFAAVTTPAPTHKPTTHAMTTAAVTMAPTAAATTANVVATDAPTTVGVMVTDAPTTIAVMVTDAPTTKNVMVTNAPTTGLPVLSNGSMTTDSPAFTNGPTTTVIPCKNFEDDLFNCASYDQLYSLCAATTGTLFSVATKRCREYCGLCSDGTATTKPVQTVTVASQTACVDHDPRCVQFQKNICQATVTQEYVIATCPLTCNKCTEYFASLMASLTVPTVPGARVTTAVPVIEPPKCYTCGDIDQMIPCYSREVFANDSSANMQCSSGNSYCMTDIYHDEHGNTDIFKRCVSKQTCDTLWTAASANQDYCLQYGAVHKAGTYECHFCCTGDNCNVGIKPAASTLVK